MTNFKKWFKLMWSNLYIQLFVVAIIFFFTLLHVFRDEGYCNWRFWIGLSIPILMMVEIGYLGFYKFWKETKKYL